MAISTDTTPIHRIFPSSEFEEIADYLKDLIIALTSRQSLLTSVLRVIPKS